MRKERKNQQRQREFLIEWEQSFLPSSHGLQKQKNPGSESLANRRSIGACDNAMTCKYSFQTHNDFIVIRKRSHDH